MRFSQPSMYAVISLLLVLSFFSACQKNQEPLRVALLEWPPYELAFWARENNWFTEQQVVLLEYKTPTEVTRAFATGAVDIIAVTSNFALTVMEEYPDTRIIVVIDASNGADSVLSKQPLKKGDSFKGLRIGTESSPLGSFILTRFKDKFDIPKGELETKYVHLAGELEMWESDEIDLLITYEPMRSKLKAKGAYEIFTSKEIPNEIIDVFLIREEKISSQKDNLQAFVNGWFKAVDDINSHNPTLFEFIGSRENIPAEVVRQLFKDIAVPDFAENKVQLSDNNKFIALLEIQEKMLLENNLMTKSVDKKKLVSNQALMLLEPN